MKGTGKSLKRKKERERRGGHSFRGNDKEKGGPKNSIKLGH